MFARGFDDVENSVKKNEERKLFSNGGPRRFWLGAGEMKEVSFIDDEAVHFDEHAFELNGKWGNYEHCIGLDNGCPFCLNKHFVYTVTVFTIIDHTGWTDRNGQTYVDQKKILAAKPDQAVLLRDLAQTVGGLKGKRVLVRRSSKRNSPSWGTSYTLVMKDGQPIQTDWSKFDKSILVPFDYEKLYAPKTKEQLQALYQQVQMSSRFSRGVPTGQSNQQGYMPPPQSYPAQSYNSPADQYGASDPFGSIPF